MEQSRCPRKNKPVISEAGGIPIGDSPWESFDALLWLRRLLIFLVCAWLIAAVLCPVVQLLAKSLHDRNGDFVGCCIGGIDEQGYRERFQKDRNWKKLLRPVWVHDLDDSFRL